MNDNAQKGSPRHEAHERWLHFVLGHALVSFFVFLALIFVAQLVAYHPACYGLVTHETFRSFARDSGGLVFLLVLTSPMIIVVGLLLLATQKVARRGAAFLAVLVTFIVTVLPSAHYTRPLRHYSYQKATGQLAPLLAAIERYHRDKGDYPQTVQQLVPQYLDSIPRPAMNAADEFRYGGEESGYDGNPFVLSFYVRGWGARDQVIYLPSQNYERFRADFHLYVIGRWAIRPIH